VDIRPKRAYETASPLDRYRVRIDRLWPRGLSKKSPSSTRAHDTKHNDAIVLAEVLRRGLPGTENDGEHCGVEPAAVAHFGMRRAASCCGR
jgi:hypothetical protein